MDPSKQPAGTQTPSSKADAPTRPCCEPRRRALGGLFVRKERWGLSWPGRILIVVAALTLGVIGVRCIYPFLAVNHPTRGQVLIVEGWIPTRSVKQAATEFQQGHYQHLLIVRATYDVEDRSYGDYVSDLLLKDGVPKESLDTLFCPVSRKDRTYHSALDARRWLAEKNIAVKSVDVATLAPHARRSRLLYEKAFGPEVPVGVIALEDPAYDHAHWWRFSEGVREMIGESIAYTYARFLFHPSEADRK